MTTTDSQLHQLLETVAHATDDSLDADVRRALIDRDGNEVVRGLLKIIFNDEQFDQFELFDRNPPDWLDKPRPY